jgi:3-hydroxyisobutyrate dehydrogenase
MGAPMAANAARAGLAVRAWNRTRERAEPLAADGVTVCATPAEAAAGAAIVVTMLSDADATLAAVEAALADGATPAVWVQAGTIGVAGTERCATLAGAHGVALVDAPVLGTKGPAQAGQLVILASGPAAAKAACAPFFAAVGGRTVDLGDAGAGTRLKLVVNHWIMGIVENVAETVALARALGVEPADWLGAIAGGAVDTPYAHLKGKALIAGDLEPAFRLELARKDVGLVLDAAARHDQDAALMGVVAERMSAAILAGHGDEDMIATYFASAPGRPG